MYSTPTPVPPPRSTQIRSLRCASLAAHAASMGLRPHRKFARNLSSAMVIEDHALGLNRVALTYIHEFEMGTGPAIGPGRGWPKYLLAGVPACLMPSLEVEVIPLGELPAYMLSPVGRISSPAGRHGHRPEPC
eukprot:scaffold84127_cov21-Tisochrysis_lutea.AAC.6